MATEIRGNLRRFDDDRVVFIGRNIADAKDTAHYIGFRSAEGRETKFRLSPEAMAALVEMYAKSIAAQTEAPVVAWPSREEMIWQLVNEL